MPTFEFVMTTGDRLEVEVDTARLDTLGRDLNREGFVIGRVGQVETLIPFHQVNMIAIKD